MQSADDFLSQYQPNAPQSADAFLSQYAPKASPSNIAMDMIKSGASQGARDIAQIPMWLGDTANAATQGVTRLAGAAKEGLADIGIGDHLSLEQAQKLTNPTLPFVGSQQVIDAAQPAIKSTTGADINYQPQTKEGEYTAAIAGAAPYALNPEMSISRAIGMGAGQQGAKDIASQFTDDPRYQQVAGIAGGAAGMMAADPAVAGAKFIADNDIGAKLPSILGDNRSGSIAPQKPVNSGLTSIQAFDVAKRAYQAADATGGTIQPADVNKWLDNSAKVIPQTEEGKLASGESPATNFLTRIEALRDKPMSFQGADEIDKAIGQEISKAVRAGDNTEVARLYGIKNNLQDAINTLPDTSSNITEAKQAFSAASKMRDVENIMANAEGADVPSTAVKNGFRTLAKQLRNNPRGYTPEEISDINDAAKTGLITGALKTLGSRLLSGIVGTSAGAVGGGAPGAIAGFVTGEGLGYPLRQAANSIQMGKGQTVLNRISSHPVFDQKAPLSQSAPSAPQSFNPTGILGQASQQPQPTNNPQPTTQTISKAEPLSYTAKQPFNTSMQSGLMSAFAKAESNNNPNAKNPNSSASGLMQFTDGTWKQMVKRYGAETGIGMMDKSDPKAQMVMAQLYAKDNIARMAPFLQRNPTKGELYQAHMLGADGALRLIKAVNETPNKQAIMMFPKAVTTGNHNIFFDKSGQPRTVADVYNVISKKV